MIHMGLLNVLMNRLKTSIKDLKESHNTERKKTVAQKRTHDDDEGDDMEMIFPKRVKVEITPSRYIPVSLMKKRTQFHANKCFVADYQMSFSGRY